MRVLAIDPGYDRMGLAVVEGTLSAPRYVWSACETPPRGEHATRLAHIDAAVRNALRRHRPDAIAIETLYFSANRKTALKVAEARGAALSAAASSGRPVLELSPSHIKIAVTGNGRATKAAVARMLALLIALPKRRRLDDEHDAIALAIAALSGPLSTRANAAA